MSWPHRLGEPGFADDGEKSSASLSCVGPCHLKGHGNSRCGHGKTLPPSAAVG